MFRIIVHRRRQAAAVGNCSVLAHCDTCRSSLAICASARRSDRSPIRRLMLPLQIGRKHVVHDYLLKTRSVSWNGSCKRAEMSLGNQHVSFHFVLIINLFIK